MLLVDTFCGHPGGDSSTHVWTVTDNILETSIIIANSFWGLITAPDFICFTDINPNYALLTLILIRTPQGSSSICTSHQRSPRLREVKELAQGHTANQWRGLNWSRTCSQLFICTMNIYCCQGAGQGSSRELTQRPSLMGLTFEGDEHPRQRK